jgi:hypothetical protein
MKQFASWFTHGVPGGGALRKQIFESKNGDSVLDAVDRFFAARAIASEIEDTATHSVDETMLEAADAYCD